MMFWLEYLWDWLARWCVPDLALRFSVPPAAPHW